MVELDIIGESQIVWYIKVFFNTLYQIAPDKIQERQAWRGFHPLNE